MKRTRGQAGLLRAVYGLTLSGPLTESGTPPLPSQIVLKVTLPLPGSQQPPPVSPVHSHRDVGLQGLMQEEDKGK